MIARNLPDADRQLSLLDGESGEWTHTSGLALRVRQSTRARRLILQVVPPGILEVVVPRGVRAHTVAAFVRDNHAWIETARRELGTAVAPRQARLPAQIHLSAVGESVTIQYIEAMRPRLRQTGANELEVHHRTGDDAGLQLRRWLLRRARAELEPWLWREAKRLNVEPSGVQIRLQRTRWGSCSSQRRISLNAALLFVEPELVRYLFVHELCHLAHMNHSKRFWTKVRHFEPDCDHADQRLGLEWKNLPAWLFGLKAGVR